MNGPVEPITLANCESEPIHIPGAIQPHGVLIATRDRYFRTFTQKRLRDA